MTTREKSSTAVRAATPARVLVLASRGTSHVIRVVSGRLPRWLTANTTTWIPTRRIDARTFVCDVDEIGEAELHGEVEILDDEPTAREHRAADRRLRARAA